MVDARGERVTATETHHPELLWASRGGGGGTFGALTSLVFRVHPIGAVTTFDAVWPWSKLPAVLDAWQRWAPFTDDRLTSILQLQPASTGEVGVIGLFLGGGSELCRMLAPLGAIGPYRLEIEETTLIEAARGYAGVAARPRRSLPHGYAALGRTRFKNTSDYARAPLGPLAVDVLCEALARAPNAATLVQLDAYGGAVNRVPADATAFPHRAGTLFSIQYQTYWNCDDEEDENVRWVLGLRAAMAPFVSGEAYVGYADRTLASWPSAYFGANLPRLVAVKTKVDPDDVFCHPQSILPVKPPTCPRRDP
jgi:FAD/FMN-containing dehydrogenase